MTTLSRCVPVLGVVEKAFLSSSTVPYMQAEIEVKNCIDGECSHGEPFCFCNSRVCLLNVVFRFLESCDCSPGLAATNIFFVALLPFLYNSLAMVSQKVFDLCCGEKTVSSELAQNPKEAPGDIAKRLYGDDRKSFLSSDHFKEHNISEEDLERAYQCGKWGPTRPSKLFLKVRSLYLNFAVYNPCRYSMTLFGPWMETLYAACFPLL